MDQSGGEWNKLSKEGRIVDLFCKQSPRRLRRGDKQLRLPGICTVAFFALCVPALPPGHWGGPSVVAYKSRLRGVSSIYVT